MARKLKHEKLISNAGVAYEDFTAIELAEIINLSILEKAGPTKKKYQNMLANLTKPIVFLSKIIEFMDIDFEDCNDLVKVIENKKESMKADIIRKVEAEIAEKQKLLEELRGSDPSKYD
jgi:hypothetical protein